MTQKPAAALPEVAGIDLSFRPPSYFWPLDLEAHLLSRVKGAHRRAALRQLIEAGRLDEAPDILVQSALSEAEREIIGRIHPAFMGGEYLPNLESSEVEIARITIDSTTRDVTSVFARRGKKRIYYRVVDEYGGDTLTGKGSRTSIRPLTLGELEALFNRAWSIFDVLEMNFGHEGYPMEAMQRFVIAVESEFYPQIGRLYRRRIEAFAVERDGARAS
jgi:hypothetical protein